MERDVFAASGEGDAESYDHLPPAVRDYLKTHSVEELSPRLQRFVGELAEIDSLAEGTFKSQELLGEISSRTKLSGEKFRENAKWINARYARD